MVNLHKLVQRVINEEVRGSDLRPPEQVGGLSDWEEVDDIPFPNSEKCQGIKKG